MLYNAALVLCVIAFKGQQKCFLIPEDKHKCLFTVLLISGLICLYGVQLQYIQHCFSPTCCIHSQQRKNMAREF